MRDNPAQGLFLDLDSRRLHSAFIAQFYLLNALFGDHQIGEDHLIDKMAENLQRRIIAIKLIQFTILKGAQDQHKRFTTLDPGIDRRFRILAFFGKNPGVIVELHIGIDGLFGLV